MTGAIRYGFVDRRCPERESRRKSDVFPESGAVMIAIGFSSFISFAVGLAIGAWVF